MIDYQVLSSLLVSTYYDERQIAVLPWSLNIVDCYFLFQAFKTIGGDASLVRTDYTEGSEWEEELSLKSVYQIYNADRDAGHFDIALVHASTGAFCFWDQFERFVLMAGPRQFIDTACPYPEEIARHRFVEVSWELEGRTDEQLFALYDRLKSGDVSAPMP